jgi:peptidoglycan/xylan/chitin deacetylase (PgdA/CDA1 family)
VNVELTIGGMPACVIEITPEEGVIRAARLRALLTTSAGVELVHLAVREALIGGQWTSGNLRDLLASRRARTGASAELRPDAGGLSPRSSHLAAELLAADPSSALIGARRHGPPGSAASRRAVLAGPAREDIIDVARAAHEPVLIGPQSRLPSRILYAPELLSAGAQQPLPAPARGDALTKTEFGRHHFEALFASGADPWRYTTPYEARKYEQTLSLLPSGPIGRALEVGCAEGHFTDVLATRVERLVAADISAIALERAAARCATRQNVSYARVDIVRDPLPGDNDVIVCSEMLYFVGTLGDLHASCRTLRDALRDGGRLITAHANLVADSPEDTAYAWDMPFGVRTIKSTLSATPGLQLVRELRTPLYSVLEFERGDEPRTPQVIDVDLVMPAQHIADTIRWQGTDGPRTPRSPGGTLAILMYHRVSDRGSDATLRYRVTPAALAEQLGYLRDAGLQGTTLAEWTSAIHARQAIGPGRVVLTFDDAYEDFEETALPLLQQYGIRAALFVVTDRAGGTNTWDAALDEPVRLMDWAAIGRAADAGIEIGAHSATHPPLTGLAPADIVAEASRARADIQRNIGRTVTAFAYPYGDSDPVVEHLVGGCGFLTGVTCRPGRSALQDRPLRLPRIEITGTDTLTDFIRKVGAR